MKERKRRERARASERETEKKSERHLHAEIQDAFAIYGKYSVADSDE